MCVGVCISEGVWVWMGGSERGSCQCVSRGVSSVIKEGNVSGEQTVSR